MVGSGETGEGMARRPQLAELEKPQRPASIPYGTWFAVLVQLGPHPDFTRGRNDCCSVFVLRKLQKQLKNHSPVRCRIYQVSS